MDKEEVFQRLAAAGLRVASEERNGNDTGWSVRLDSGAIIQCYDSGKIVVQGRNPDPLREILNLGATGAQSKQSAAAPRTVFVVYGHDEQARNDLERILRRWKLEPLILDQLPSGGQTIIEKLESVRREANFAVVLATPDDEGYRVGHEGEKAFRARQNVVLELGMMLALLGRPRVAILLKSDVKMERPSDIQGLIYIPYKDSVVDAALPLAKEINAQGIKIDLNKV